MEKKENISFGEYFDAQHDRIVDAMQNKNSQLNKEWREEYDKRQKERKEQREVLQEHLQLLQEEKTEKK